MIHDSCESLNLRKLFFVCFHRHVSNKKKFCTLFGTAASFESHSDLPIASAIPVSFYKWITETSLLSQKRFIYQPARKSNISSLGNASLLVFTALLRKQLRIYLSHTQDYHLFKYCCTTVTYHFLFIHCSPPRILLPLPKPYMTSEFKAEIFSSCYYKPRLFYS